MHIRRFLFIVLGIDVKFNGKMINVRAILLSGIFDLPAKCVIQETVQYNGKYGCSFCEEEGKIVTTQRGGHVRVFPKSSLTEDANLRTKERVLAQALVALEHGETVSTLIITILDLQTICEVFLFSIIEYYGY